jgi:hypothetical protein
VHISGLEVEGRHPRALMEFALLPLEQVIGLKGPSPRSGSEETGLPFRHQRIICNLKGSKDLLFLIFLSDSAAVRFVFGQKSPDDPCILVRHRDTCLRYTELPRLI